MRIAAARAMAWLLQALRAERIAGMAQTLLRFRISVLLVSAAVVALCANGMRHLEFSTDYRDYFSADNPQLRTFDAFQQRYSRNDNSFVMLEPHGGDIFDAKVLEAARTLTARAWQLPYVTRVSSLTNFQHSQAAGDDLAVAALLPDGVAIDSQRIEHVRSVALREPLLLDRLVARDGRATAVNIITDFPRLSEREVVEHVEAVRALAAEIEARHPGIDIAISGVNLGNHAFSEASLNDLKTLYPVMFVLSTLIIWLIVGSFWGCVATSLLVLCSTVSAMGIAGYLGVTLTPPSLAAPLLISTMATADAVHVIVLMMRAMRQGKSKRDAIVESLQLNFTPIFLTAITTAIGFATLNFTDSPPLRHLGNISALGVMVAWLLSIVSLPVLVWVLPVRAPPERKGWLIGSMGWFADFVLRHRQASLWGTVAVSVALCACIPLNENDDNLVRYFDDSIAFRQDTDRVASRLTGTWIMELSLDAGRPEGIVDPEYLRKVEAYAQWWRSQPEVTHVASIVEVMKRLNMNMHGDDPAWYRLPEQRELAAQYLLLYELSLPAGLDLNDNIDIAKSSSRFSVIFRDLTSSQTRAALQRGEQWLREHAPELATQATGAQVMFLDIAERNIRSMLVQLPASVLLIWLLLMPALRSLRIGALALIPLVFPVFIAFGIWGLVDGTVIFTMAIVLGVITGIADDEVVHFLSHYLHGRREHGLDPESAIRYTFESAGSAILGTTAILITGFLVIAQSSFLPNGGFSKLGAIALGVSLLFNFLLLPPLLLRLDKSPPGSAPATREPPSFDVTPLAAGVGGLAPTEGHK